MKIPKTIGACVDLLFTLRANRLAAQKKVDLMKEEETALREHVLKAFDKATVEGAKGRLATASITRRTVASVQDWALLYAYVQKENAFDLLQRRVNDGAYRARLEDSLTVPGVEPLVLVDLSVTKSTKKEG